jgi:pyruvate/2-oxoglutarate dehydrogenase complex dihydrolipoamide acyltransferase (E2) component
MRTVIKVPKIGMTMVDATIAKFCKQPGESFRKGDPLFEIETDKVAHAVEATADGVMLEHCVAEGDEVDVGGEVCIVEAASS